jgi:arabinose-5-phosphate isomerase
MRQQPPAGAPTAAADLAIARRVLAMETAALNTLADRLDDRFVQALDIIYAATGRVICAGVGKSGHVARKIAATMASTGTPAAFVHPTEASHGDLGMIAPGDVVLALSRSGETAELSDLIHYTRRFGVPLIGMTAQAGSTLAQASDVALLIPDAPEACAETKAPTTSTTLMMALGDALAVALLERRGFKAQDFRVLHPGGRLGAMLSTAADLMHAGADLPLAPLGASIADGVAEITARGFGVVGVTDPDGRLVGVVTDGDLRRFIATGRTASTVDEVMTRAPFSVAGDTLAASLLKEMHDRRITVVFVLEAGRPVGLVHMHDLLKAGVA